MKLAERLMQRLADSTRPLPRSTMAPSLAYGRHRGPCRADSRCAAVVIALYQDAADRWTIPLTRRPTSLAHHGGQVCLPGGRIEAGETRADAALREYREELGVEPADVSTCGELPTHYVYASDNCVHPIVVVTDRPEHDWVPDPVEVAEVIPLPLRALFDEARRGESARERDVIQDGEPVDCFRFRASTISHQNHRIWGATAVILDQFTRVLDEIGFGEDSFGPAIA